MTIDGLSSAQTASILAVLRAYPQIDAAILYGSRASGGHRPQSDIDLALVGIADGLRTAAIAEALEDLSMPYRFDVTALDGIASAALRAEIVRNGRVIYRRDKSTL